MCAEVHARLNPEEFRPPAYWVGGSDTELNDGTGNERTGKARWANIGCETRRGERGNPEYGRRNGQRRHDRLIAAKRCSDGYNVRGRVCARVAAAGADAYAAGLVIVGVTRGVRCASMRLRAHPLTQKRCG